MYAKTNAGIEIHAHPFLENNSLTDVVQAMQKNELDIASLSMLDSTLFPYVIGEALKLYPNSVADSAGIILPNDIVMLNGREYSTKEGFHLITVGYSADEASPRTEIRKVIDVALKHEALVVLDHPYVDNGKTRTAGHISPEMEDDLEAICKGYSGRIALEWNGYCVPWIRTVLKQVLNIMGLETLYFDVNQKTETLSENLKNEGCNVPVVADTDLHARSKRHLKMIGRSKVIASVEGDSAFDILQSMKTNIFSGNYANVKNYVPFWHLLDAFCFPILFPQLFKNPRSRLFKS